jgi:hypothetical protein
MGIVYLSPDLPVLSQVREAFHHGHSEELWNQKDKFCAATQPTACIDAGGLYDLPHDTLLEDCSFPFEKTSAYCRSLISRRVKEQLLNGITGEYRLLPVLEDKLLAAARYLDLRENASIDDIKEKWQRVVKTALRNGEMKETPAEVEAAIDADFVDEALKGNFLMRKDLLKELVYAGEIPAWSHNVLPMMRDLVYLCAAVKRHADAMEQRHNYTLLGAWEAELLDSGFTDGEIVRFIELMFGVMLPMDEYVAEDAMAAIARGVYDSQGANSHNLEQTAAYRLMLMVRRSTYYWDAGIGEREVESFSLEDAKTVLYALDFPPEKQGGLLDKLLHRLMGPYSEFWNEQG